MNSRGISSGHIICLCVFGVCGEVRTSVLWVPQSVPVWGKAKALKIGLTGPATVHRHSL